MPKGTMRPPLTERAHAVQVASRAVVKGEQRVAGIKRKLAESEQELRARRKAMRDLLADPETFGPDGANVGTLP